MCIHTKLENSFHCMFFLLGTKEGVVIDHINRNGLDNRKCNLRFVKTAENAQNNWGKHITFNKRRNAYVVEITRYGISYRKAGFKTIEEAIRYRDELKAELNAKNEELKKDFENLGEKLPHAVFCGHGWRAEVRESGRTKMLGTFHTKEEAHEYAMDYLRKRDGVTDEKTQY